VINIERCKMSTVALLPAADLYRALSRVEHAISTDANRPHINSVLFEIEGRDLRVVATDAHRLARQCVKMPKASAKIKHRLLISHRGAVEIRRACKGDSGAAVIEVHADKKHATISIGEATVTVELVDAQFPPYENIIPMAHGHTRYTLTVTVEALLKAIDAVDADNVGCFVFQPKPPLGITLTGATDLVGCIAVNADVTVDLACEGSIAQIGFKRTYVREMLDALATNGSRKKSRGFKVVLETSSSLDPMVGHNPDDGSYLEVIMPVRLEP